MHCDLTLATLPMDWLATIDVLKGPRYGPPELSLCVDWLLGSNRASYRVIRPAGCDLARDHRNNGLTSSSSSRIKGNCQIYASRPCKQKHRRTAGFCLLVVGGLPEEAPMNH